jgi:PPOX class probable F420-dependent enzyme
VSAGDRVEIPDDALAFLVATKTPGILATVGRSGGPVTSAVWYAADRRAVFVSTPDAGTKASNVRGDDRVSFIVDARERPYCGVAIEGSATLLDDPNLERWSAIARRYLGEDLPEEFLQRARSRPRAIIELRPRRVRSWNLEPA